MTPELIAAIQTALGKQFEAGKAVGVLEHLMLQAMPKPAETVETAETEPPQTEQTTAS